MTLMKGGRFDAYIIMALISYKGGRIRRIMFAVLFVALWMFLEGVIKFSVDILFGQIEHYFFILAVCAQSVMLFIVAAIRLGISTRRKAMEQRAEELFFITQTSHLHKCLCTLKIQ